MSDKKKVAFFDIDGTVFRSAVMMEIVDRMIVSELLPKSSYAQLVKAENAWKDREGKFEEYNNALVELISQGFKGVAERDFSAIAEEVIDKLKNRQYRYTHDLIESLRADAYTLVAISGMPQLALEIYNRHLGFDYIYGWELGVEAGEFTGQTEGIYPHDGKGKVAKYFLSEHAEVTLDGSVAVGDTESEVGLFELVERPIAFNPNRPLFEAADEHGWEIVVERKDMIYHLNDGRYSVDK